MDYSGNGDYDVNTPFKYEEDDQDHPVQTGGDNRPTHHGQDDLMYSTLDFAAPTPTPQHGANLSTSTSSSHANIMDVQSSIDLPSNSSSTNHIVNSNTGNSVAMETSDTVAMAGNDTVAMETSDTVAMETSQEQPPSSPESDEVPLAARTRTRPSRSTRTKKSFAEINEDEEEEETETKPPKGINLFEDTPPSLVGTQSIFSSNIQKERRANLTKGVKRKKKKEPEFCRFCFTNELSLTKIRSAKLPSHPTTKLTTLVPSVSDVDLCLTEKWTNPSFQLVCDECVLVFTTFYEFRQAVQVNDTLLRRLYCSSKAKSKKPPTDPTAVATPRRGRPPKPRDPSSDDDSDAKSIVSTKSNKSTKRKARSKRKGVTDDEDTDGYLSSVSRASRKSTASRKSGKKKRGGVTSDEETDGYMSSVSRKSTNTGSATKAKKKKRYNSDSDNEDVKSDASDGVSQPFTAYDSFNIKQESPEYPDLADQKDYQAQSRSDWRAALKQRKREKSARKRAKWDFKRSLAAKNATTRAQEELDLLNHQLNSIKQEEEGSDEENRDVFEDSSWDDSSGVTSSEWSSVDVDNNDEETDGYLTSTSTRSTGKKRRKYKKKKGRKSASGNQTGCESETGGETDVEKPRIKVEDAMDALMPVDNSMDGTQTKRKRKPLNEKQLAHRRTYCKKRLRVAKFFKKENYTCKYCPTILNSYEGYLKHLKSNHHGYETSTLCFICGFSSNKRSTLSHHIQDHIQPRQKQKQICEICCAEVYHINGHIKDKHSGFFLQCPHCPKRFPRKTELNNHVKGIHLKHELTQSFVCEYCNKEFTFFQYLRRHMRTHTNEKPYKCVCGLGFNFNVSLKNHKQKCSTYLLQLSIQQQQQQLR